MDLMEKYPRNEIFIKSLLFSKYEINDDLLELEDGTIIGWNESMMDKKEHTLIDECLYSVQIFTADGLSREFTIIDSEYMINFYYMLAQQLLLKIVSARLERIGTYEVNDDICILSYRHIWFR